MDNCIENYYISCKDCLIVRNVLLHGQKNPFPILDSLMKRNCFQQEKQKREQNTAQGLRRRQCSIVANLSFCALLPSQCISFPSYDWQSLIHTNHHQILRVNAISFGFPNIFLLSRTCISSCLKLDGKILEQDYLLIFKTFTTFSEIHSFIKKSPSEESQCKTSHLTLQNANIKVSHVLIFLSSPAFLDPVPVLLIKTRKCGLFLNLSQHESVYSRCTKTKHDKIN